MGTQSFAPTGSKEETVNEIHARLPNQWVVVIPTQAKLNKVVAGYVLAHSQDEGVATAIALGKLGARRPRLKVMWTGKPGVVRDGGESCLPTSPTESESLSESP